jgi:hypothetical protein
MESFHRSILIAYSKSRRWKCATKLHRKMRAQRPLGAGLQEQAPNHLKLLWSKARVVSVKEKDMA